MTEQALPPVELGPRGLLIAEAARLYRAALRRHGTWLYAIQAGGGGPIKIGMTSGPPSRRLATLQQGNAERLRGIAAWRALPVEERELHAEFAESRLHGEWFEPTPQLVSLVAALGGDFEDWS